MKNVALGIGAVVVIGLIIVGFRSQSSSPQTAAVVSPTSQTQLAPPVPKMPTIQVSKAGVVTLVKEASPAVTLHTGDTLIVPSSIRTDKLASATIYFPDGSEARLGPASQMTLREAAYEDGTQKLDVHMKLDSGRVWSKIIELATPDSHWEVQTANAVATVRGTAFDVRVIGTKSSIYTASHSVGVSLLDPKTAKVLAADVAVVAEGKVLTLGDTEVAQATANKKVVAQIVAAPKAFTADSWVQANVKVDAAVDARVQELEKSGVTGATLREKLQEDAQQKLQAPLPLEQQATKIAPTAVPVPATPTTQIKTKAVAPTPIVKATPVSLEVSPARPTSDQVGEGTKIAFRALLKRSDGSVQDVTTAAKWQVVGPIGRFTAAGQFFAELDPSISETGEGSGSVVAIWTDTSTEEQYLGKGSIFKVELQTDTTTGPAI